MWSNQAGANLSQVEGPTAKGVVLCSARDFVRKTHGDDTLDAVLDRVTTAQREELLAAVPIGWYPVELVTAFHRAVATEFGEDNRAQCVAMGRFSADWALNMFYKLFLRFKSPHWLVERSSKLWSTYHSTGSWTVLPHTDNSMAAQLRDFAIVEPAFCCRLQGWFERAAELTGAPGIQIEHTQCRARGHECCEFRGTW